MITREQWGAAPNRGSPLLTQLDVVYLHHAVDGGPCLSMSEGKTRVRQIQAMHQAPPRRWTDIAYSALVDQAGHTYEGRRRDGAHWYSTAPGATAGHNRTSLAICVLGNTNEPDAWTDAARDAVCELLDVIERHWHQVPLRGHRDVSATACPGDHAYQWVSAGAPCDSTPPPTTPDPTMSIALLED